LNAQSHPFKICFIYGFWTTVNPFHVTVYDRINGSFFNILSPKEWYRWKEQSCLVIMMYNMACVYGTIVRFSATVQAVIYHLLSLESLVHF
jgi:hypothetical protein